MKKCFKCKEEKSLSDFTKNKYNEWWYWTYCLSCYSKYKKFNKLSEKDKEYIRSCIECWYNISATNQMISASITSIKKYWEYYMEIR